MCFYRFVSISTYLTRATTLIFIFTIPFLSVLNSFWHWVTLFVYKLSHTCFQNRKQNSTHAFMTHVVIFPNHSNVSLHEQKSKWYKGYKIQSFVFLQRGSQNFRNIVRTPFYVSIIYNWRFVHLSLNMLYGYPWTVSQRENVCSNANWINFFQNYFYTFSN